MAVAASAAAPSSVGAARPFRIDDMTTALPAFPGAGRGDAPAPVADASADPATEPAPGGSP